MADESIRNDFTEGLYEVFTSLFNEGVSDGIKLYLLSDKTKSNIYKENKYKTYKQPKLLVAQATLTPTQGEEDVRGVSNKASFSVPLKSLQENELGVTNADLNTMRKGVIEFHGVYYSIDIILPRVYLEDVFLMYRFECTEDKNITSILIES